MGKKPIAIVYTSNTGFTKKYAEMLGMETGLPVYDAKTAIKTLTFGDDIVYLGWMKAGKVVGYSKVSKNLEVVCLIGVGMGAGSQIEDIRKSSKISSRIPVFYMQGGFDMDALSGVNKIMMSTMEKTVAKKIEKKAAPTQDEREMLDLIKNGGSRVSKENIKEFMEWYNQE